MLPLCVKILKKLDAAMAASSFFSALSASVLYLQTELFAKRV